MQDGEEGVGRAGAGDFDRADFEAEVFERDAVGFGGREEGGPELEEGGGVDADEELAGRGGGGGGGAPDEGGGGDGAGGVGVRSVEPGLAGAAAGEGGLRQRRGTGPADRPEDLFDIVLPPLEVNCREIALVPGHGAPQLAGPVGRSVALLARRLRNGESPPRRHPRPLRMPDVRRQPRLRPLPLPEPVRSPRRLPQLVLRRPLHRRLGQQPRGELLLPRHLLQLLRGLHAQPHVPRGLPPARGHGRRVVLLHLVGCPPPQPLRDALDVVGRRAATHVAGHHLEGAFVVCALRARHCGLEGLDFELARADEGVHVHCAGPELGVGALDGDGAGVVELGAFAVGAGAGGGGGAFAGVCI